MREIPLDLGAWARALGLVAVTAAMIMASIHFRDGDSGVVAPAKPGSAPPQTDPLAHELARCQSIGIAAQDDSVCASAWAENRRRFFTYRPADAASLTTAPPALPKSEER